MHKKFFGFMVAAGSVLSSCSNYEAVGTSAIKADKEQGFSLLSPDVVKLTLVDPITHDMNKGQPVDRSEGNGDTDKTRYYFDLADSCAIIHRRTYGDGWASHDDGIQVSDPILYDNMPKSMKENFSKAVEYANKFPKLRNNQ